MSIQNGHCLFGVLPLQIGTSRDLPALALAVFWPKMGVQISNDNSKQLRVFFIF
jgi:hypothetical protein